MTELNSIAICRYRPLRAGLPFAVRYLRDLSGRALFGWSDVVPTHELSHSCLATKNRLSSPSND